MGRVYFRKALWVETVRLELVVLDTWSRSGHVLFVRDIFAVWPVSDNYRESHIPCSYFGLVNVAANDATIAQGHRYILFENIRMGL